MGTRGNWAKSFASMLGNNNPSKEIISWVSAWTVAEGTKARFNPLATTYDGIEGQWEFNSAGVKNYPDRDSGLRATVATVTMGFEGYSDIVSGIRSNDVNLAQSGLTRSPWGTNPNLVWLRYITGDTSGEMLASEENDDNAAGTRSGGTWDDPNEFIYVATPGGMVPMTRRDAAKYEQTGKGTQPSIIDNAIGNTVTEENVRRLVYGTAGVVLLIIVGFIAFKRYVPATVLTIGAK